MPRRKKGKLLSMPPQDLPEMLTLHDAQRYLTPPLKFGDRVQIKAHKVWVGQKVYSDLMEQAWQKAKQLLLDDDVRVARLEIDEYLLGLEVDRDANKT